MSFSPDLDNHCVRRCCGCVVRTRTLCCALVAIMSAVGLLLLVVLLSLSIKRVDDNDLVLEYRTVTRHLSSEVYSSGLHTFSPDNTLLKYPAKAVVINDQLSSVLTQDGVEIKGVTFTVQLAVVASNLKNVTLQYGGYDTLHEVAHTRIWEALHLTFSLFPGDKLGSDRNKVDETFSQLVKNAFDDSALPFRFVAAQVPNIPPNPVLNEAIAQKQNASETIELEKTKRNELLTVELAHLDWTTGKAEVARLQAEADAAASIASANQRGAARRAVWNERKSEILVAMQAFGLEHQPGPFLDLYLEPSLQVDTLTAEQEACLAECEQRFDCAVCFTDHYFFSSSSSPSP